MRSKLFWWALGTFAVAFSSLCAERLILVTGCARSGTTYMTKVLRAAGLDVLHEAHGADGTVSWTMAVTAHHTPWGPSYKEGDFKHIFHQVRHPLLTIASVMKTEPKESWDFIRKHVPQIKPTDNKLVKAVKYWIYWNRLAEEKAEMTYRIEDLEYVLDEIGAVIGYSLPLEAVDGISKTTNHRGDYEHVYTWSELKKILSPKLYAEFLNAAIHYGYVEE